MEVFTVAEERGVGAAQSSLQPLKRCSFRIPSYIAISIQIVVTFILSLLLCWDMISPDVTKDMMPVFGRLILVLCLLLSFYAQSVLTAPEIKIGKLQIYTNLVLYVISILCGFSFWIIEMQLSSGLSSSIANYTAIEPIILVTTSIITFYFLRRLMEACNAAALQPTDDVIEDEEECSSSTPLAIALILFSVLEALFGIIFAILISFVLTADSEFIKRVICILSLFLSAVVNELGMAICKGGRTALFSKLLGYFVNLLSCQFTWWLSYYKGLQLTLYGLGVGFLHLLFGVLYTLEMSLKVAQLNSNPGPMHGCHLGNKSNKQTMDLSMIISNMKGGPKGSIAGGGVGAMEEAAAPEEEEEEDVDTDESSAADNKSLNRIISTKCVAFIAVALQIGLSMVPCGLVVSRFIYPELDVQKMNEEVMANWVMWALGFFSSILLNEIILFQNNTGYKLVCICNAVFCLNFCMGSVLSYQAVMVSIAGPYFLIVTSGWFLYFLISHLHFLRLTRYSLKMEESQILRIKDSKTSLFVASGIECIAAFAAFLPATDLNYFPGKIFSLFSFPSLVFGAETMIYYGKKRRGPFLVTFTSFFLGSVYGQVVWYVSVILDEEKVDEFFGISKPWLFGIGLFMGGVIISYIFRFLHVLTMKWSKRQ